MSGSRQRLIVIATALIVLFVGVIAGGAVAQAAPYSDQPVLAISTDHPAVGATVTLTGSGYRPGETVVLSMPGRSERLASVVAGSDGTFTVVLALPSGVSGPQSIVARGMTSGRTSTVAITIGDPEPTISPAGSGGSALPDTGVAVVAIGSVGLLLLVGGGVMLLGGRRSRSKV
jgi:hypothetical protein